MLQFDFNLVSNRSKASTHSSVGDVIVTPSRLMTTPFVVLNQYMIHLEKQLTDTRMMLIQWQSEQYKCESAVVDRQSVHI